MVPKMVPKIVLVVERRLYTIMCEIYVKSTVFQPAFSIASC